MTIWHTLQSLETLEETMSRLYECLRLNNAPDAGAAAFFARLRDEEISHRDIVRYERRVTFRTTDNHEELAGYDGAKLEQMQGCVEDLIARAAGLGLEETLRLATLLEQSATEEHYRTVAAQANPELGRLVRQLGSSDQAHAVHLGDFARSRGYALES